MLRFTYALLGAAFLLRSAGALAAPTLVPPAPLAPLVAPYPAGQTEAARVIADVVVDRDGGVVRVEIVEGDPPFTDAARAASATWRFAPATRDGAPVPARIRARIDFDAPSVPATDAPPPDATESAPPPPTPPPPPPAEEVRVRTPARSLGRTTLTAEEVRTLPGAFGEPSRAIESMPGVTPYVSGLPFVSVRGAMPSATTYTLDGMRLPLLFHYGLGVTAVHPALIESMDLFTGATPARDGRAFSVIELGTRRPAERPHAELAIRAIDSSALVETPIADGRVTVLVAGRYGYPGPVVQAIDPRSHLAYSSYQARVTWRLGDRHTLTLLGLGVHDEFGTTSGGVSAYLNTVDVTLHRLDLRYDARIGDSGAARAAVTLGRDRMSFFASAIDRIQARAHLDLPVGDALRVRGGLDMEAATFLVDRGAASALPSDDTNLNPAQIASMFAPHRSPRTTMGAWLDAVWRPSRDVELVPGVRVDRYDAEYLYGLHAEGENTSVPDYEHVRTAIVSPRLAARIRLAPWVDALANVGTGSKEPQASFPAPGAEFLTAATARAVQEATMLDVGFEARLPGASLRALAFLNGYRNANLWPIPTSNTTAHADGRAHGAEVMLRTTGAQRFQGWLSYTFTVARMHVGNGADFDDPLARRHVVNAVGGLDLGAGFHVGARLVAYSGAPFATRTFFGVERAFWQQVEPSTQEPPGYWRLDARVEKRWTLSPTASVAVALEWLNATMNREAETICRSAFHLSSSGASVSDGCMASERPLLSAPSLTLEGRI